MEEFVFIHVSKRKLEPNDDIISTKIKTNYGNNNTIGMKCSPNFHQGIPFIPLPQEQKCDIKAGFTHFHIPV